MCINDCQASRPSQIDHPRREVYTEGVDTEFVR
jgi:hypothetical protein